jgi:hypothetical protein
MPAEGASTTPLSETEALASSEAQHGAHAEAVGKYTVLGYAHWLCDMVLLHAGEQESVPIILKETFTHTGSRIWHGAWVHREWALDNQSIFHG